MNWKPCVVALASFSATAFGGKIYDNGAPPDNGNSTIYFAQLPLIGEASIEYIDDFTLAPGASTIRDIHWWGDTFGHDPVGELDSFVLTIYATAAVALAPGEVVTVANITSIERTFVDMTLSQDTWFYSARVDDIALSPDTRYWLGISGDSGLVYPWGWRGTFQTLGSAGYTRRPNGGLVTEGDYQDAAFYLTDDVPAPGAIALLGLTGVLGTHLRRRRD